MKQAKGIIFLFLLFVLHQHKLYAQNSDSLCDAAHCTCTKTLVPPGLMIVHLHNKNEWMISYRYMHMQMSGLMSGTNSIEKENVFTTYLMAPENMRMDMHMIMAMYGITDRLTLMTMTGFSVNNMSMAMFAPGAHHHNGTVAESAHTIGSKGLADIKLHALYGLVKTGSHQLIATMGVSLPTGSIGLRGAPEDPMYANQQLPYNMQLGSGTVDLLPGLSYLYSKDVLNVGAQVTGSLRPFYNAHQYHLGNDLTMNTWLGYQWWGFLGTSLRAEGNLSGHIKGMDPTIYLYNEPAANPYNYGGKRLTTYAGLYLRTRSGALSNQMIAVEYGLPVYQNLNGIQMPVKQMINASWSLTF